MEPGSAPAGAVTATLTMFLTGVTPTQAVAAMVTGRSSTKWTGMRGMKDLSMGRENTP